MRQVSRHNRHVLKRGVTRLERDETRAKEFDYRVTPINKAGQGQASNTVMVVL